jgi:hypothetical protein
MMELLPISFHNKVWLIIQWERIKKWIWIPLIILAIYLTLISGNQLPILFPSLVNYTNEPVIQTLLGAVVGAVIALYGSIYVSRREIRTQAVINKRDDVYIPIYDELLELRKDLADRYCLNDILTDDKWKNPQLPKFIIWSYIKQDSRNLQTPVMLRKELDKFVRIIEKYNRAKDEIRNSKNVEDVIHKIVVSNLGEKYSKWQTMAHSLFPCEPYPKEVINYLESQNEETEEHKIRYYLTRDQAKEVGENLYRECSKIYIVQKFFSTKKEFEQALDNFILSLEMIIGFINSELEQHNSWF